MDNASIGWNSLPSETSRTWSTTSSDIWRKQRCRLQSKASVAVGLPVQMMTGAGVPLDSTTPIHSSRSFGTLTTGVKLRKTPLTASATQIMSPSTPSRQMRFMATDFDMDWRPKPRGAPVSLTVKEVQDEHNKWLTSIVRTKKKKRSSGLDLTRDHRLLRRQPLREEEQEWDPLKSLKEQGPPTEEEIEAFEEDDGSFAEESEEELEMKGENDDMFQYSRGKRRRSVCVHTGGRLVIPGFEDLIDGKPVTIFDICKEEGIPVDVAKAALDYFGKYADTKDVRNEIRVEDVRAGKIFSVEDLGSMDHDGFEQACCEIADCKSTEELAPDFLESAILSADRDGNGDIDYVEFLVFYNTFSFSEEVLLGAEERNIRRIARKYGLNLLDMDKLKHEFGKCDEDGSGLIEFPEFERLVTTLLKVPKGQELPKKRKMDMWRDARQGRKDDLDLEAFVGFFVTYYDV
eukprot:TRINITY_DN13362_c0_g1_i1.p1 TRINITY_DN13362_c0_g1~~TRINITY_DN13362_c0_g1_i1.p1  ORF type:complete len:460 (-),score=110.59 TRINITY_DN13362_c0_g1_i1:105-1484(-)